MNSSQRAAVSILVALVSSASVHAAVLPWDHTDLSTADGFNISGYVSADDFVLTNGMLVTGATVWFGDDAEGDNGTLDSFSGVLSWAIYQSNAGAPGTLIAAGTAANLVLSDTGLQGTTVGDIVQVSFELTSQVNLSSGTYFLALHENAWQSANDASPVWWMAATSLAGEPVQISANLAPPSGWFELALPSDTAFAVYGSNAAWGQGAFQPIVGYNITDFVGAADFYFEETTVASTFDVWLVDGITSDNGVLENFGGSLGWAIYHDVAGQPADLIVSGTDFSPDLADTGIQGTGTVGDVVRARIDLGGRRTFENVHYWIALREGPWGTVSDGSAIYWTRAVDQIGFTSRQDHQPASPTTWLFDTANDTPFTLYEGQIFASGFEAGGTCAWSNGASIDCP